jgi:S-adenosylmethionine:tRNA ribosyltransferase-isomerase
VSVTRARRIAHAAARWPKSSHLLMLTAIAGESLLAATYEAALASRYLWHEFGAMNLILP